MSYQGKPETTITQRIKNLDDVFAEIKRIWKEEHPYTAEDIIGLSSVVGSFQSYDEAEKRFLLQPGLCVWLNLNFRDGKTKRISIASGECAEDALHETVKPIILQAVSQANKEKLRLLPVERAKYFAFVDPAEITDFLFKKTDDGYEVALRTIHSEHGLSIYFAIRAELMGKPASQQLPVGSLGNLETDWFNLRRDVGFSGNGPVDEWTDDPADVFMRVSSLWSVTLVDNGPHSPKVGERIIIGLGDPERDQKPRVIEIPVADENASQSLKVAIDNALALKHAASNRPSANLVSASTPFSPIAQDVLTEKMGRGLYTQPVVFPLRKQPNRSAKPDLKKRAVKAKPGLGENGE